MPIRLGRLNLLKRWMRQAGDRSSVEQLQHELAAAARREAELRRQLNTVLEQHRVATEQHAHAVQQYRHAAGQLERSQAGASSNAFTCPDPANQLFFLFGLPKSAGQSLRLMLDRCRTVGEQGQFIPPSLARPNGLHVESPPTEAVFQDFPRGGWMHSHASATLLTLDFLHAHSIRHIVLFRHPLDQLVAYRCHLMKHRRMGYSMTLPWHPTRLYSNPQAVISEVAVDEGTSEEQAYSLLIREGYFEAVLDWIGRWSAFRSECLSLVVSYEDLISSPEVTVRKIIAFLDPMLAVPECGMAGVLTSLDDYVSTSHGLNQTIARTAYPRGYTGQIGVYRNYLSARNVQEAGDIYRRFCRQSPYGKYVEELYPSLDEERKKPQSCLARTTAVSFVDTVAINQ